MFRKILATPARTTATVMLLAAVPVKKAADAPKDTAPVAEEFAHYQCKPSELPLYQPLHSYNKPKRDQHPPKNSATRETIESGIRVVRTEVQSGINVINEQKKHLDSYIDTAKAHSQSTIDYLNQPHNILPRSGAIAIGGLSGFIFAARGGFIKKVLYTSIGAGAIASLCYPRQAEQFARDALYEGRKGYAIAYNFVKGVKPGDEVPIEPISHFPTNLEDVKFLLWDLYDEGKEAMFGKKK